MRLQAINATHLKEHYYLDSSDQCYFFGEMTPGQHDWTPTKSLISNLKKRVGDGGYQYKPGAIRQVAHLLLNAINPKSFSEITLVPIPPSKKIGDPEYDDRMWNVLQALRDAVGGDGNVDIRRLVYQTESYKASHTTTDRASPDELESIYQIDDSLLDPAPTRIVIVDDFLTTGCHYKTMQKVLLEKFPNAQVQGIFVARRKLESDF